MSDRKTIFVQVYSGRNIPDEVNLIGFINELNLVLNGVDEEHRKTTTIEFESEYDTTKVTASIGYSRLETDEEYYYRLAEPQRRAAQIKRQKEFEKLNDIRTMQDLIKAYPEEAKAILKDKD